jgi:hypothetical protein
MESHTRADLACQLQFIATTDEELDRESLNGGTKVTLTYDIFRKLPDGGSIWVEAVQTLELARVRLTNLIKTQPSDYVVYDLSRRQIVARATSSSVNLHQRGIQCG